MCNCPKKAKVSYNKFKNKWNKVLNKFLYGQWHFPSCSKYKEI